jgi:hypothetical protein
MRHFVLTLFLLGLINFTFGQSKTVKLIIDSTKIYFRYFYNSKNVSYYTLNDSVSLVGRKITVDKFYLEKLVNGQKNWTKIYRIELANDSLRITTRAGDKKGNHKFIYSKEPYYNSFLVDN